jgi:ribosomal protein L44E
VARLENDTESIYELITEVRSEVRSTLDEHTRRFDRIETTLGEVVRRLPEPQGRASGTRPSGAP